MQQTRAVDYFLNVLIQPGLEFDHMTWKLLKNTTFYMILLVDDDFIVVIYSIYIYILKFSLLQISSILCDAVIPNPCQIVTTLDTTLF